MPIQARRPKAVQPPTPQIKRTNNAKLPETAIDELDRLEREAEVIEKGATVRTENSLSRRSDPIPFQPTPTTPTTNTPAQPAQPNQPVQINQSTPSCVSQLMEQGYSEEEAETVCQQFDVGNIAAALWQRDNDTISPLMLNPIMNNTRIRASRENSRERFDAVLGYIKAQYPGFSREGQIEIAHQVMQVYAGEPISVDTTIYRFTKQEGAEAFKERDRDLNNKEWSIIKGNDGLFWCVSPAYAEELAGMGIGTMSRRKAFKKVQGIVLRRSDFWGDLAGTLTDMVQQAVVNNLPPTAQLVINQVLDAVQRAQVNVPEPPVVAPVTIVVEEPQPGMMMGPDVMMSTPPLETSFPYLV